MNIMTPVPQVLHGTGLPSGTPAAPNAQRVGRGTLVATATRWMP